MTSNTSRAVALAVHHQQVGEGEHRVAQDVGPDLGQLGLDRVVRTIGAPNTEKGRAARSVDASAHAPDNARKGRDLLEEAPRPRSARARAPRTGPRRPAARAASRGTRRRTLSSRGAIVERRISAWPGRSIEAGCPPPRAPGAGLTRCGETTSRPYRDHDVVGLSGSSPTARSASWRRPVGKHPLEQRLGAGLVEGHPAGAQRGEHRRIVIDAEHADPAIGEGQRQRQLPHGRGR